MLSQCWSLHQSLWTSRAERSQWEPPKIEQTLPFLGSLILNDQTNLNILPFGQIDILPFCRIPHPTWSPDIRRSARDARHNGAFFIIVSVIWVRATDRNISVLLVSLCQFREWGSPSWLGCRQSWWIALVIIKVNLSPLSILTLHQLHFDVDDHSSIKSIVITWSASHPCEHRSHLGCPPWSCYHDIMSSLLTHIISLISNKHWPWYWWRKLLLFLGITALLKFVTIVCDGMIFHEDDGNSEKEEHLHTLTMECE